jgi:hypothetical protein
MANPLPDGLSKSVWPSGNKSRAGNVLSSVHNIFTNYHHAAALLRFAQALVAAGDKGRSAQEE